MFISILHRGRSSCGRAYVRLVVGSKAIRSLRRRGGKERERRREGERAEALGPAPRAIHAQKRISATLPRCDPHRWTCQQDRSHLPRRGLSSSPARPPRRRCCPSHRCSAHALQPFSPSMPCLCLWLPVTLPLAPASADMTAAGSAPAAEGHAARQGPVADDVVIAPAPFAGSTEDAKQVRTASLAEGRHAAFRLPCPTC